MYINRNELNLDRLSIAFHIVSGSMKVADELEIRRGMWPSDRPSMKGTVIVTLETESPLLVETDEPVDAEIYKLDGFEDFLLTGIGFDDLVISPDAEKAAKAQGLDVRECLAEAVRHTLVFDLLDGIHEGMPGPKLRNRLNELEQTASVLQRLDLNPEDGWELAERLFGATLDTIREATHTIDPWLPEFHDDGIVTRDRCVVDRDELGEWHAWDYKECIEKWTISEAEGLTDAEIDALVAERLAEVERLVEAWHAENSEDEEAESRMG